MTRVAQITKGEKRALRLLVLLAIGSVLVYGAWHIYQYVLAMQSQQVIKEFKQKNEKHMHGAMHTASMLDSTKHSIATPDDLSFGVDYDWSGVMQITVDKYEVFDSPKDAGLTVGEYHELSAEFKTYGFALITFRLKNIDAKPLEGSDEGTFNIGTFHYNLSSDASYFNSSAYPQSNQYYYHYKLDPGEEKTVVLGFYLYSDPSGQSPELSIGNGSHMHYHIPLSTEKDDKQ
ncbi:hypothetical protein ACUYFE_05950 [Olegusella massiliensis]|uniref:hypothetical protein n=1 Tax=Olegusella massiliensis TaxID=1776381 RepID=UPI0040553BC5